MRFGRPAILTAVFFAVAIPLVLQSARGYHDIVGTRHALASERGTLRYVVTFQPLLFDLERLRAAANRPQASAERLPQLATKIDAEVAAIERGHFDRAVPAATCETTWPAWRARLSAWTHAHDDPSLIRLIMQATCFVNERINDSQLGFDVDPTVQMLTSTFGINTPAILRRIGASASLVDRGEANGYDRDEIVAISRSVGYVTRLQNNLDANIGEDIPHDDPKLGAALASLEAPERGAEVRFERRVDAIITAPQVPHGVAAGVERLALAAIEANRALAQRGFSELELRLAHERDALQRRTIDLIWFVAGGLAIVLAALLVASRVITDLHGRALKRVEIERDSLGAQLARAAAERTLSLTEGQLRAVFESADTGIAIFDDRRRIAQANRSFVNMRICYATLEATARQGVETVFAAIDAPTRFEIAVESITGSSAWLTLSLAAVFEGTDCRYVIVTITDITDSKVYETRLRDDALRDPLTGLANRKAFGADLSAACAARTGVVGLFFIDLDDFKPVNDVFGHAAGDTVLTTVGARLRGAVTAADSVARFGGDEFAVLIRDVSDASIAASIADRLVGAIEEPISFGDGITRVSASVGVALDPRSATPGSAEDLLARADAAMYRAKTSATRYVVAETDVVARGTP